MDMSVLLRNSYTGPTKASMVIFYKICPEGIKWCESLRLHVLHLWQRQSVLRDGAEGHEQTVAGRVWIHGTEQASPGLLGFILSARKEPKGELLRCVFDTASQPAAASEEAIKSCRRLDLVHNMIVNGRNGSYRILEVQWTSPCFICRADSSNEGIAV